MTTRSIVDLSLGNVLPELVSNPILVVTIILSMGVCMVNGATDAPNSIATAISTRSLSPKKAIIMAVTGDFLGITLMTFVSTAVADTIFTMVDFHGDSHQALVALLAAMVAIIVWGGSAWMLSIPSSQSHSLIAGLTGAAIALQSGFGGVNWDVWMKVIYGLVVSMGLGFGLGWMFTKLLGRLCKNIDYRRAQGPFRALQIATAGTLAFMHGAQDGQKFMAICVLGVVLAMGGHQTDGVTIPFWIMLLCAVSMGIGTAFGGSRIIKSVGMDMVKLEQYQGFSADLAASACLFIATFTGLPVSTTHTKATSVMGVGASKRLSTINLSVVQEMVLTWVLTFPGCGLIGFLMAKLFMFLF